MTSEDILKALGSDSTEPSADLFAAAAANPEVLEKLKSLLKRVADTSGSVSKRETNLASWAAYVFAESGSKEVVPALYALLDTKAEVVTKFAGAYADLDLPVIFLRLAGKDVVDTFGQLSQTYGGAAEVRASAFRAAGAAWAHGLISREAALLPIIDELGRMCDEGYAELQDDEWFDTLLDAALEIHPAGLEDSLEALREYWDMQDDWDAEIAEALEEPEQDAVARLQATYPLFTLAMQFVDRWDEIDAAEDQ